MRKHSAFPLLIQLAQQKSDAASIQLRLLLAKVREAEQQLLLLKQYRIDYERRLTQSASAGMEVDALRNFRMFLHKLGQAIAQQETEAAHLRQRAKPVEQQWRYQQRRAKSFGVLQDRQLAEAASKDDRKAQNVLDELAVYAPYGEDGEAA